MQNSITKLGLEALYDLSLMIGKSLDFKNNCQSFTSSLKKHLNQTSCSIWRASQTDSSFVQIFKNTKSILKAKSISEDNSLFKSIKNKQFASFVVDDVIFLEHEDLFNTKKGSISIFKLSDTTFLVMQDVNSEVTIPCEVFDQLEPLLNLFSKSLKASLINNQFLSERNQSKNINDELRYYKMMVENISDGILISDLDNNVIFTNNQLTKLSGYEKEEIIGSKTSDLHFNNEHKESIEKKIQRSFKGSFEDYEISHVNKKTGLEWWANVNVSPFKDRNSQIIGAIAVIRDITSQKETELNLTENEWKLRNFVEKSPLGIAINDGPDNIIINDRFCEMLGYTKQEFTKYKLVNEITFPEEQNTNLEGYQKLLDGKIKSFEIQKRYIKKNGTIMWGNLNLSVLKNEKTGAITHFAMVEDIHDQKIMNDSLTFINQISATADSITLFNASAKKIAETFEIPYTLIVEIDDGGISCSSRAFWQNGEFSEFNYNLKNSACQDAIDKRDFFIVKEKVQKAYPKFDALKDLNAESYIASPLLDSEKNVIGLIILLDTKKMSNIELIKQVLKIYATRISAELQTIKSNQVILGNSRKLKEAEKFAKLGSWEYNFETKKLFVSEGIYRIFDWQIGNQLPSIEDLRAAVHPEDEKYLQKVIENTIRKGKPWEIELRYKIKGELVHTINKGKASLSNGKIVKFFGTIQDITDKKEAETNLMVATSKYESLLENINDAVVILDMNQQIVDCNLAAQKILEYPKSEMLNLSIKDFIAPEDLPSAETYVFENKGSGFFRDLETRIVTKHKTYKHIKVDSDAIYKNGEIVGSRDIFRDITELKEIEQKRELLYQKVEQANKELKDFAYIVSHDLKAPLRAIGSLSQWLSEDYAEAIDEKGQTHLKLLNNRVHRMHNFIDGILEYSRLGRIKIEKEPVNIQKLVDDVIESLDSKNNKIKITTPLPTINCEKIRISQVFQNLISNSIKYNDKKEGLITIDYKELPSAHQFSITDNGPGIDKKYHDKIFQIFQTLQIRDTFESTGIGLTIVKKIVELHSGEIIVKSKTGKGAKFIFTLEKI